jgi:lysozyme family protein
MASASEIQTIIMDSELVLRERKRATSDVTERTALERRIEDLRDLRRQLDHATLAQHAAVLNGLAATLEAAVGSLRARPFDHVLGQLQDLFDRIGAAQGTAPLEVRLPRAQDSGGAVAEPSATVQPPPAAPAEVAPPTTAEATPEDDATRLAKMFDTCKIRDERLAEIDRHYVQPLLKGRMAYESVGTSVGIPWWFVGIVHGVECSFSFECHLHNGDPLTDRTRNEPRGRPIEGSPPFTWSDSARDALIGQRLVDLDDWTLGTALDRLERYNGLGYRKRGLPSPYLWSFSNHFVKGKFVEDGVFDPEAPSRQCGGAVLLKRLAQLDIVTVQRRSGNVSGEAALAIDSIATSQPLAQVPGFAAEAAKVELAFPGAMSASRSPSAMATRRVQEWCCLRGSATLIDGDFGTGTAEAVRVFQARQGIPATGIVDERTWIALTMPMRRALATLETAPGETLNDVVARVAAQHLAERPFELTIRGQGNSGPWVRLYMNGNEGEDQLWCAGFVCFVVGQAAKAMGGAMPFRRQVGVDALVKDAKDSGRFIDESRLPDGMTRRTRLRPGMIFVRRKSANDWNHTGIVTEIGSETFRTIEGNTNDEGSRDGVRVRDQSQSYISKDFIELF